MGADTYTEISEKRTSKLGYLFLFALFFFLIIIGQTVFSDISKIPERPIGPSYCANTYVGSYENIRKKPTCNFNEIDREFGLDVLINDLEPDISIIIGYTSDISSKTSQISSNERQLNELLNRYDLSLQETIAGEEETLLDKPEIKDQIVSLWEASETHDIEIDALKVKRADAINQMSPKVEELRAALDRANDTYKTRMAYYNLKLFLLKMAFVLPFFGVSLYYYLRYKKKDSPYTIIITSVFYASTILFLQIVLKFLYHILPTEWLARIFKIFMDIPLLKYVVYYGVTAIVILLLGGVVYFIQKKIYDPQRVALRRLKENECPSCSVSLNLSDIHCPNCGRKIKTKCSGCGNMRYVDLKHCPACGST